MLIFLCFFVSSVAQFQVQLFATHWIIARQAPLSMEFFRQEFWSGLPFPSPREVSLGVYKSTLIVLKTTFFNEAATYSLV